MKAEPAAQKRSELIGFDFKGKPNPFTIQLDRKPVRILYRRFTKQDIPRYNVLWDNGTQTWVQGPNLQVNYPNLVEEFDKNFDEWPQHLDDDEEALIRRYNETQEEYLQRRCRIMKTKRDRMRQVVHKARIKNGILERDRAGRQTIILQENKVKRQKRTRRTEKQKKRPQEKERVVIIDQEQRKWKSRNVDLFAEIENKAGQFQLGDQVDEILNSLTDPHTKKLVFFVSWKEREDGTKPFPSWQTHENMSKFVGHRVSEYLTQNQKGQKDIQVLNEDYD